MESQYPQIFLGKPGEDPEEADYDPQTDQWCDDHWQEIVDEDNIPPMGAVMAMQDTILGNGQFYEIAYRIKNGYGPPSTAEVAEGDWEVPEGERPGIPHINSAMAELSPLCCYIEGELEEWDTLLAKARGEVEMDLENMEDE